MRTGVILEPCRTVLSDRLTVGVIRVIVNLNFALLDDVVSVQIYSFERFFYVVRLPG